MTTTLNAISLEEVQTEHVSIETGLVPLPPPDDGTSTTADTIIVSLIAPMRQFQITGIKVDTIANLRTFASGIISAAQNQETAHTYHSDFFNANYNVKISGYTFDYVAGEPATLEYQLTFIDGSSI